MTSTRNTYTGMKYLCMTGVLLVLAACSSVKDWTGWGSDDADANRLPGDRMRVLGAQSTVTLDPALEEVEYRPVEARENLSWPQRGGTASNALGSLKISGFERRESAVVGKGKKWRNLLVTAPVVADEVLYAMDAHGYVSAHAVDAPGRPLWVSEVAANKDEDILGGGLAVMGKRLFVTTGEGRVFALDTQNGARIWERNLGSPIRSAPKLHMGNIYVNTVEDLLFALDAATGLIRWQHRGLDERIGFLSAVSPAIGDNIVVAAHSSGELYGLAADTGQELWSDSLSLSRRTSATSVFSGFDGDPVIAGGVVFAASNNGLTTATHLLSGRRLWEQEIAAADTPWLANNYLFLLTSDSRVVALYARDGRAKWQYELPRFRRPERQREPYRWRGPMMFGEQLAVFGAHGEMVLLSPQDGAHIGTLRMPGGMQSAPVVAAGVAYVVTDDARLQVLR